MENNIMARRFVAAAYALTRPAELFSSALAVGGVVGGALFLKQADGGLFNDTTGAIEIGLTFLTFGALFGYATLDMARPSYQSMRETQRRRSAPKQTLIAALLAIFGYLSALAAC